MHLVLPLGPHTREALTCREGEALGRPRGGLHGHQRRVDHVGRLVRRFGAKGADIGRRLKLVGGSVDVLELYAARLQKMNNPLHNHEHV